MVSEVSTHVVWLNTPYDCLRLWVDSINSERLILEHLRPLSAVSIPILVPDDGELRALCDPIRHIVGPMMGDSQCKDEAIQRASHIVNHITEDQRKRLKGDWVSACLQHDILRVVWVDFKPGATVL